MYIITEQIAIDALKDCVKEIECANRQKQT